MLERLLDSVILIDHLNDIDQATKFILSLDPEKTAISVITRAEILVGIEESDEGLVKAFLDQYYLFGIDKEIADLAATLRKNHSWKLPDAFQAAISINNNIKLTTRNTKDFDPAKHSFIEIPYSL
ncbi:MAG: PIN domain nuclease [Deltaproteobacteria bacterium]|nr:MAG: PIN domain nuclease [Deltaproteobacteria bacterium]